jgi:hypothetical protein
MIDAERAALVERTISAAIVEVVEATIAAIEPAIRADERARVVAEATTDEAVRAALALYWANPEWREAREHQSYRILAMRSAIRAALGDGP